MREIHNDIREEQYIASVLGKGTLYLNDLDSLSFFAAEGKKQMIGKQPLEKLPKK